MKTSIPKPNHELTDDEFDRSITDYLAKFRRMTKAKRRALLVKWDILNPDGTLRRYPMDHVPLGPRE